MLEREAQSLRAAKEAKRAEEARKRAEEAQRAADEAARAQEKAEADDQALDDAIRANPKVMALVFGASLCYERDVRGAALAEIAKQKKYARLGGVQNNVALYQLQQTVRWADEEEAKDRKLLRTEYRKVKPTGCGDERVRVIIECHVDETSECSDSVKRLAAFLPSRNDDDDSN